MNFFEIVSSLLPVMLIGLIGISGSGGSAGPAVSGGMDTTSSGRVILPGGTVGDSGGSGGMSLTVWMIIAVVAGIGAFLVRRKLKG